MQFEYAIRRAHHCGRYGAAGANADLYRGFMGTHFRLNEAITKKSPNIIEQAIEYGVRLGCVRMALDIAAKEVISKFRDSNPLESDKIEELRENLDSADNPTKMAQVVTELDQIFLKLGLYPG